MNGTQLNGHRVSTAKLEHGDKIVAGQTVLKYEEAAGAAVAAEEPIELIGEGDIIEEPVALEEPREEASPTVQLKIGRPSGKGSAGSGAGRQETTRLERRRRGSGRKKSSKAITCSACGREVTEEEFDAGEGAQSRLGYVCGRCVEKRQKGRGAVKKKGSLEDFLKNRRRGRR
jgi:hypothetical protein